MAKLKDLIIKSNQNADFIGKYDNNKTLKKKLFWIGSPIAISGFVVALTAFIMIGIFGSNIKSINQNTPLLISLFIMLVGFSVVFGLGLYILKQASALHLEKQEESLKEEDKTIEVKEEK